VGGSGSRPHSKALPRSNLCHSHRRAHKSGLAQRSNLCRRVATLQYIQTNDGRVAAGVAAVAARTAQVRADSVSFGPLGRHDVVVLLGRNTVERVGRAGDLALTAAELDGDVA
jgi:hypothetical protein